MKCMWSISNKEVIKNPLMAHVMLQLEMSQTASDMEIVLDTSILK